ncbi:hypothetical protein F4780DRAFT_480456 [Xylariomycetidae sp. FL0641]|nr:hypothetical protein F4780DRAFT_480456 [Xylariomycetidae sp. FL0641]
MQRQGSPWLLKLTTKISLPNHQIRQNHRFARLRRKREAIKERKTAPPYEFSDLLLKLEDEGCQYVRPFDPDLDGVTESPANFKIRQTLPLRARVDRFEKQYDRYTAARIASSADAFNASSISDLDIFSATLVGPTQSSPGNPAGSETQNPSQQPVYTHELDALLDRNGIPPAVRTNFPDTVSYMLRWQELSRRQEVASEDPASFANALSRCETFHQIISVVTTTMQTSHGCNLVSASTALLAKLSNMDTDAQDVTPAQLTTFRSVAPVPLLAFWNNLRINLSQKDLPIASEFYQVGLRLSLHCGAYTAVQTYLKFCIDAGCTIEEQRISEFLRDMQSSLKSAGAVSSTPSIEPDYTRRLLDVFGLLTGCVFGEEAQQPGLGCLIHNPRMASYKALIHNLAQIGAFRTMWHIWHQGTRILGADARQGSNHLSSQASEGNPGTNQQTDPRHRDVESFKITAFAGAIMGGIGSGVREVASSPSFTAATGQFEADCKLDMQTVAHLAAVLEAEADPSQLTSPAPSGFLQRHTEAAPRKVDD